MSIFGTPQSQEKAFELVPEGKHCGVICYFIDCGHHRDTYLGVETIKHKVYVAWELDCLNSEGKPHWKGDFYTASDFRDKKTNEPKIYFAGTSNFNALLRAWTGEPGDKTKWIEFTENLIFKQHPAQITIEHVPSKKDPEKIYSVIDSVKPYKGTTPHKRVSPFVGWAFGAEGIEELPNMVRREIEKSIEFTEGNYIVPPRKDAATVEQPVEQPLLEVVPPEPAPTQAAIDEIPF